MLNNTQIVVPTRQWWVYAFIGLFFLGAATWIFSNHAATLEKIDRILSYGVIMLGTSQLILLMVAPEKHNRQWWTLLVGILEIMLGTAVLLQPGLSMELLMIYLGLWLFFRGGFLTIFSFKLNAIPKQPWLWLFISGTVVAFFGILTMLNPTEVLTRYFWFGMGCFLAGVVHLFLAWQLRKIHIER
jgi:uncharacterized membrane protein HdeD (DUF308 family)